MVTGEVAKISVSDAEFLFSPEENQKRGILPGQRFSIELELVAYQAVRPSHIQFILFMFFIVMMVPTSLSLWSS